VGKDGEGRLSHQLWKPEEIDALLKANDLQKKDVDEMET